MRRFNIPTLANDTGARGQITAEDVAVLRQNLFNGEEVWPHEARALFDLMQKRLPACEEWQTFFIEAMSEYVINGLEPVGMIDEKNARWLAAMVRRDLDNCCDDDLHLLVAVMEKAGSAPLSLQHFALDLAQSLLNNGMERPQQDAAAQAASRGAAGANQAELPAGQRPKSVAA